MNVSRENKKVEAIKRMNALRLFKPCIRAFKNADELQVSEITGGLYEFYENKELINKIYEFEEKTNSLVYHVIHTYFNAGGDFLELYDFLFVSDYEEEWEVENADISNGYVFVYSWNKTVEDFSEYGTIAVQGKFGGLVRDFNH